MNMTIMMAENGGGALERAAAAVDEKLASLTSAIESIQAVDLPAAMAGLSASESARATVAIGMQTAALVALYLRLSGVDIRDHPIISEELKKLKALAARVPGEGGAAPTSRLDMGAAGRLIAGATGSSGRLKSGSSSRQGHATTLRLDPAQ
jgi:hypothetical protein